MGLYEGIKDVAMIVQKADNIDLYKKLLDLSAQALDMQAEIASLREENANLKKGKDLESDIEFHKVVETETMDRDYPYITLKSDENKIRYCAICWGKNHKLIPLYNELNCIVCRQEMFNK